MGEGKAARSGDVVWHHATVTRARREAQNKHRGAIIWLAGLASSGKSTLARAAEEERNCRKVRAGKMT